MKKVIYKKQTAIYMIIFGILCMVFSGIIFEETKIDSLWIYFIAGIIITILGTILFFKNIDLKSKDKKQKTIKKKSYSILVAVRILSIILSSAILIVFIAISAFNSREETLALVLLFFALSLTITILSFNISTE